MRDLGAKDQSLASAKASGLDEGMRVLSYLIAGLGLYGGLGWLGDHFLGTNFLLPIGIILGAGLAIFVIIRRFGNLPDKAATTGPKVKPEPSGPDDPTKHTDSGSGRA